MIVYDQESASAMVSRATAEVDKLLLQESRKGLVNGGNFNEVVEASVDEVVNNLQLLSGDEVVDNLLFNKILQNVLIHANW